MNLTQEQLAEKFGTSPQAISRWEIGATYPDIEMLPMIASFFETSVDALLGVTEEEKEKRCSELQKSFEIAVRAKDVQETVEIMREIRRNLKDYQQYWFWGMYNEIWKVRLFQDKNVLEEMRLLAEEVSSPILFLINCSAFAVSSLYCAFEYMGIATRKPPFSDIT